MSVFFSQIVPCYYPTSLSFPAIPLLTIRPPWGKKYIFKILVERAINSVDFFLLQIELEFSTIFTHFGD